MMDERILTVLKAVAGVEHVHMEDTEDYCIFCDANTVRADITELKEVIHEPDCPVTLARLALRDMGIPPSIYKVEYEYCFMKSKEGEHWQANTHYTIACDEARAIANVVWMLARNVHASVVRVLPLDEVKNEQK